jgi:hypothetical protein
MLYNKLAMILKLLKERLMQYLSRKLCEDLSRVASWSDVNDLLG